MLIVIVMLLSADVRKIYVAACIAFRCGKENMFWGMSFGVCMDDQVLSGGGMVYKFM